MSIPFITPQVKATRRAMREHPLILDKDMLRKGVLLCEVCKSEKEMTHAKWYYDNTEIVVEISFVCRKTNCTYSKGREYAETFSLSRIEVADPRKRFRAIQADSPQNSQADFFNKMVTTKGIGQKTASKVIQHGINTLTIFKDTPDEKLEEIGINKHQIGILREAFV